MLRMWVLTVFTDTDSSAAISIWVAGPDQAERGAALVRELGHGVTVVGATG